MKKAVSIAVSLVLLLALLPVGVSAGEFKGQTEHAGVYCAAPED